MNHIEKCRHCAYEGPQTVKVCTTGIHHAEVRCAECGKFLRWLSKPDGDPTKYKRPAAHRDLVSKYGKGFCEMCLRKESDFPKGTTLEAQHVQEYQDNGDPSRENIWVVCTACHRMIHWVRTYHGGEHVQPIVASIAEQLTRYST